MLKNFLLSVSLLLVSYSSIANTIKVGIIEYPPHINFDEKDTESPVYKYINPILTKLGHKVTIVRLPGERANIELMKGNVDIILPIGKVETEGKTFSEPLFHSMPGLCFKKENFIPILSATHRFNGLRVGVPIGIELVSAFKDSKATFQIIKGTDAISRGIELTQRGRIDAFYHPSPKQVYHRKNKHYKEVACSYFHGYSTPMYIAVSPTVHPKVFKKLNRAYSRAKTNLSYEYFFAKQN